MEWYRSNDYQFIALSDHNILAEGEKWKVISEDSIYQAAFKNYLNTYGEDWVNYKMDTNRLHVKLKTLEEYRDKFEVEGQFLIIQSEEISDDFDGKPLHMNATNIQNLIPPQGGNNVVEVLQNNITAILEQREKTGIAIMPHVNHPNFGYAISLDEMIALKGERFFEVYNGHPSVHNTGDSLHMSTEKMWDLINIAYINSDQPIMYGLATDDSHHYHNSGEKWSNSGRGWVMVNAKKLSPSSLITAMEAGDFYASTGVFFSDIKFEHNTLSVSILQAEGVSYSISYIGVKKDKTEAEVFKTVNGNHASFEMSEDILYVRCKVTSSKLHSNPVEKILYEMAWTQPQLRNSEN